MNVLKSLEISICIIFLLSTILYYFDKLDVYNSECVPLVCEDKATYLKGPSLYSTFEKYFTLNDYAITQLMFIYILIKSAT